MSSGKPAGRGAESYSILAATCAATAGGARTTAVQAKITDARADALIEAFPSFTPSALATPCLRGLRVALPAQ
jgi:hypothetical protein